MAALGDCSLGNAKHSMYWYKNKVSFLYLTDKTTYTL